MCHEYVARLFLFITGGTSRQVSMACKAANSEAMFGDRLQLTLTEHAQTTVGQRDSFLSGIYSAMIEKNKDLLHKLLDVPAHDVAKKISEYPWEKEFQPLTYDDLGPLCSKLTGKDPNFDPKGHLLHLSDRSYLVLSGLAFGGVPGAIYPNCFATLVNERLATPSREPFIKQLFGYLQNGKLSVGLPGFFL